MKAFSEAEIQKELKSVPSWTIKNDKLFREYKFKDFKEAFAFMTKLADFAEKQNHHPEWFNVYNRVEISMTTHDAKGITAKDFRFAQEANRLFKEQ